MKEIKEIRYIGISLYVFIFIGFVVYPIIVISEWKDAKERETKYIKENDCVYVGEIYELRRYNTYYKCKGKEELYEASGKRHID